MKSRIAITHLQRFCTFKVETRIKLIGHAEQENPKPKAYSMTWAQRLKRVFAIDPNAAR